MAKWLPITASEDVSNALRSSEVNPVVIFKHSTTCPISSIAKMRIEDQWDNAPNITWYYLDLLKHRPISNQIAADLEVHHESPQAIVITKGAVVYDVSHLDITVEDITSALPAAV